MSPFVSFKLSLIGCLLSPLRCLLSFWCRPLQVSPPIYSGLSPFYCLLLSSVSSCLLSPFCCLLLEESPLQGLLCTVSFLVSPFTCCLLHEFYAIQRQTPKRLQQQQQLQELLLLLQQQWLLLLRAVVHEQQQLQQQQQQHQYDDGLGCMQQRSKDIVIKQTAECRDCIHSVRCIYASGVHTPHEVYVAYLYKV